MFQHKLLINGAPSALLSTAKGRTIMTNVLCTNLKLKLPSMRQQKFVVPQLLRWWSVCDLLSLNTAFYYFYLMKDVLIASHFQQMCSHLWSGRSAQKLAYSLMASSQMAVLFILLSAGSCFLTLCAEVDIQALLSPLRNHKYDGLCTRYWLFVRIASD